MSVLIVTTGELGMSLLSYLFLQAESAATSPYLCYVNADIILLSEFLWAAETVQRKFAKSLMVSKRINLEIAEKLSFDTGWEEAVKRGASATGKDEHYTAIDVFVFPKGMYPQIPDFAIGRLWFDHWLIKRCGNRILRWGIRPWLPRLFIRINDMATVPAGKEQYCNARKPEGNFRCYAGVKQ